MTLNEWATSKKLEIFEFLKKGNPPQEGTFDERIFREALVKGAPQVGTTRYEPFKVHFEFIFPDPLSAATILTVSVEPPERIVFLPVPSWVVETIWQGEVHGSYHFESDAKRLLEEYAKQLEKEENAKWFLPQMAKRRE
ncbi:MAG TPA: hypothetical protein VNK96_10100 [Fimbriimonadales bacterium]|nr:hypothetical protein [Fimbriimonadales bacterium]